MRRRLAAHAIARTREGTYAPAKKKASDFSPSSTRVRSTRSTRLASCVDLARFATRWATSIESMGVDANTHETTNSDVCIVRTTRTRYQFRTHAIVHARSFADALSFGRLYVPNVRVFHRPLSSRAHRRRRRSTSHRIERVREVRSRARTRGRRRTDTNDGMLRSRSRIRIRERASDVRNIDAAFLIKRLTLDKDAKKRRPMRRTSRLCDANAKAMTCDANANANARRRRSQSEGVVVMSARSV